MSYLNKDVYIEINIISCIPYGKFIGELIDERSYNDAEPFFDVSVSATVDPGCMICLTCYYFHKCMT